VLKKQIHCPACNSPSSRWIRYAYSSWLFPVPCLGCGERFYLGYSPVTYLLLWFLISPIYLTCLLFLTVTLVPTGVVLPAFLALGAASMLLLIFLGSPTAKKVKGQK
jgi:hypothetical protein